MIGNIFKNVESLDGSWEVVKLKVDGISKQQIEDLVILECVEFGCPRQVYSYNFLTENCELIGA